VGFGAPSQPFSSCSSPSFRRGRGQGRQGQQSDLDFTLLANPDGKVAAPVFENEEPTTYLLSALEG
jgi:hypothetical protein